MCPRSRSGAERKASLSAPLSFASPSGSHETSFAHSPPRAVPPPEGRLETGETASPIAPTASRGDVRVLSESPRVYAQDGFLSGEECDALIRGGADRLADSAVELGVDDDSRTSASYFFGPAHVDRGLRVLHEVDRRVAAWLHVPRHHGENLQLQRYRGGEHYKVHHDGEERLATVIVYLSDVEEGGETVFPLVPADPLPSADRLPTHPVNPFNTRTPRDAFELEQYCRASSNVLRVRPKKGTAVVFYSQRPDGSPDWLPWHGSCPVQRGIKWIAQKWVHAVPYSFHQDPGTLMYLSLSKLYGRSRIGSSGREPLPSIPGEGTASSGRCTDLRPCDAAEWRTTRTGEVSTRGARSPWDRLCDSRQFTFAGWFRLRNTGSTGVLLASAQDDARRTLWRLRADPDGRLGGQLGDQALVGPRLRLRKDSVLGNEWFFVAMAVSLPLNHPNKKSGKSALASLFLTYPGGSIEQWDAPRVNFVKQGCLPRQNAEIELRIPEPAQHLWIMNRAILGGEELQNLMLAHTTV